jgi:hypothetical protein
MKWSLLGWLAAGVLGWLFLEAIRNKKDQIVWYVPMPQIVPDFTPIKEWTTDDFQFTTRVGTSATMQ